LRAEKNHTALQPFGFVDSNRLSLQVNITPAQGADFTSAESTGEHEEYPSAIHRGYNGLKQAPDLAHGQVARQGFACFEPFCISCAYYGIFLTYARGLSVSIANM
jgi:hypothetical protein